MSRKCPYVHSPPVTWDEDIRTLNSTRLYLVSRFGPLGFLLKTDDMASSTFKIFLGEQICSCGGGASRGRLCVHILFIMIKVLRISPNNPLTWQFSLTDNEVQKVLTGELGKEKDAKSVKQSNFLRKGGNGKMGPGKFNTRQCDNQNIEAVARKKIEDDGICGICQEDMTVGQLENEMLCYCESQCGSNFHIKCLRMYAAYNRSNKKSNFCPICRSCIRIPNPPKPRKICKPKQIICNCCNDLIKNELYRCASCNEIPTFNLCRTCFGTRKLPLAHTSCCFVKTSLMKTQMSWEPAACNNDFEAVANELMNRELTDIDYDMLLSLDDSGQQNLVSHLMRGIKSTKAKVASTCIVCSTNIKPGLCLKSLPCGHVLHESCAFGILTESLTQSLGATGAQCPQCENGWIFPSLVQDLIRKNKLNSTMNNTKAAMKRTSSHHDSRNVNERGPSEIVERFDTLSLNGTSIQSSLSSTPKGRHLSSRKKLLTRKRPIRINHKKGLVAFSNSVEVIGHQFFPK